MKNFKNWEKVFSFTYMQNLASKTYIAVTVLLAVLLFGVAVLLSVIAAEPEEIVEGEAGTGVFATVEDVYVLDLAGMGELKYEEWIPQLKEEYYSGVEFHTVTGITKEELAAKVAVENEFAVGITIEQTEKVIKVVAVVPSTSEALSASDGQEMAALVAECVEQARIANSGMDKFLIAEIQKEPVISVMDAGEEANVVVYLIKYMAPAFFGLLLYFLLLFYGQNINTAVSTEKTSKLMETLLTSVHPYGLLTGKVFAVVCIALQQFLLWVFSGVLGIAVGGVVAKAIYPESNQGIGVMIDFLKANIGESAFSPVAVVLALITFCCGFLFYSVLAGMSGSMVSRPEEAANTTSIFVFPVLISWLVCYFGTLMEKDGLMQIARNIPFTIPFCVPVDLLTGTIGIAQGIVSTVILLVFSVLVIMLSGRIYRGMVLYTGQKITLKNIINILKNKD